jgi:hypothetical protein
MYPGAYKNFDDLEDNLTQEELEKMFTKGYKMKEDEYRFLAAIQGLDLGEQQESDTERIIRQAEAKALGISLEEYELDGMFEFIDEDE